MPKIAEWIDRAVTAADGGDDDAIERIAAEVRGLLADYPMPGWK
jgi:glycine hydroxymethyltransferase